MAWNEKRLAGAAVVHFRGTLPPTADDFADLVKVGVAVSPRPPAGGGAWLLRLEHPAWGVADLWPMPAPAPTPKLAVRYESRLTDGEKREAAAAGSGVLLATPADRATGNVLRDRKNLLRWMGAVMGVDGVVAYDGLAQRFWSRAALDDELTHDADVDVESVYTCHLVTADGTGDVRGEPQWLHTHGLAELGGFDFDVLRPSTDLDSRCWDLTRALAFAILGGKLTAGGPAFRLYTDADVRAVDVATFNRRASATDRALRDADPAHNRDRAVLCDPIAGRFAKLLDRPRPAAALSGEMADDFIVSFPASAGRLMAARARQTYGRFRSLCDEFAGRKVKPIVKLGYRVDGGGPTDLEHLWFEVAELRDDGIDGATVNDPRGVSRLRKGQRVFTPLEQLTDWVILSPFGSMTPRDARARRVSRPRARPTLPAP